MDYDQSAEGIISISVYAGDGSLLVARECRPDEVPEAGPLGFWALLMLSVFCRKDEPVYLKGGRKLWVVALSLVFSVLTACIMLVGWTLFGSKTVLGLQGRCFIAALPLLLLCLRNRILVYQKNCETAICLGFVG